MRWGRGRGRAGVAAGLVCCVLGWAPPAIAAAEQLEDHFTRDWYYTEVVVFQRPRVQDHATEENLIRQPEPLVRSVRSFLLPPDRRWSAYRLYPATRLQLAFPYLDHERLRGALLEEVDAKDEALPARVGAADPPPIEPRLAPDPLLDFLNQLASFEEQLERNSYRWLEPNAFTLSPEAAALARRGGYRVILHGRWLQPVPNRAAPEPLLIQAGPRYGDLFGLVGTFDVTLGRYLHFRAHLLYTEPLLGRSPVTRALPPPQAAAAGLVPPAAPPRLSEQDLDPAGYMQLLESRRVRHGELHYLDHPKLGVLVRIEPVTPPDSLIAAYAALEDAQP